MESQTQHSKDQEWSSEYTEQFDVGDDESSARLTIAECDHGVSVARYANVLPFPY